MAKDYGAMFKATAKAPAVSAKPTTMQKADIPNTVSAFLAYRQDLSTKVKEYVDNVEQLVLRTEADPIDVAKKNLLDVANEVMAPLEQPWYTIKKLPKLSQTEVISRFNRITDHTKGIPKIDLFKRAQCHRMYEQSQYLLEQLAKAGDELTVAKSKVTDDLAIDACNKRMTTLYSQQQLVAIGVNQTKDLYDYFETFEDRRRELLDETIPMYRLMCLDIVNGTKQTQDLRKIL